MGFMNGNANGKEKQPYYFRFKDRRPFCIAGLWERWHKTPASPLETCVILTTSPNAIMDPINHRMPVILQTQDFQTWLDPNMQDPQILSSLLRPYPPEEMEAFPVSALVNNPRNDREDCIQALV